MPEPVPQSDVPTGTVSFVKIEVGASRDSWGAKTNTNWDTADAAFVADRARIAALEAEAARASWVGEIRMHSGSVASIADIPGGVWKLCDGNNGTPNLLNRFVIAAGASYAPGAAGGAATGSAVTDAQGVHSHGGATQGTALSEAQMPSHAHAGGTDLQGAHSHALPLDGNSLAGGESASGAFFTGLNPAARTEVTGGHVHNITTDYRGGNAAHLHGMWPDGSHAHNVTVPIIPFYYALCYVMRTA
jgi:hypothetical protein